jgi:hypothetical protein
MFDKNILASTLLAAVYLFLGACASTASTSTKISPEQNPLSEAYYLQFQSSEERVAQLMCGVFTCYRGDRVSLFQKNGSQDSILVYTVIVGDRAKDGMWVYKEAFLSSFPEKPLVQLFQRIERVTPDSLTISEYRAKPIASEKYIGYYKKEQQERLIDLKDFTSTGCQAGVKKIDQTAYKCNIDMCKRNSGSRVRWVDIEAIYLPAGAEIKSAYYSEPMRSKRIKNEGNSLFYKRRKALL